MKNYILILLFIIIGVKSVAQTDCSTALVVCGNTSFENVELSGFGVQEVASCGSEEHNSLWLKIIIKTDGTLSFDIIPEDPGLDEDFDFFLYEGNSCMELFPVRCSTTHPGAAGLTSNVTGTNAFETDAFEGPSEDGSGFVGSIDAVEGQVFMLVIDRPAGNSNFSLAWTGTATFNDPPTIDALLTGTSLDIFKCDADGVPDGSTVFDLTQNTPLIIGTQADVTVTYYENQSDCILGQNEIETPESYVNTSNPQIIFTRIENNLTECSSTTEFIIGIDNEIALLETEYVICDDLTDGDPSNGRAIFNMDAVTSSVFPDFELPGFTVQYFLTEQDADDTINPLPANYYNATPGLQTVFIRIDNGFCNTVQPVDLIVRFIPAVSAAELVQCDFGANPDGITLFNLSAANATFTDADPDLAVEYFEDAAALASNIPLSTIYANTANPQTVVVRITNMVIGCSLVSTLTLKVNTVSAQSIAPLEACDDNGNGFNEFDLTNANVVTTAQETATFFPTLQDALLQQNQILNVAGYANQVPYNAVVFVRIDDLLNGCSGISEVPLKVNRLPVVEMTDVSYLCVTPPGSEVTIDAGFLPANEVFTFVWKLDNTLLPDYSYSISASEIGIYTVEVTNVHGCASIRTITVLPAEIPEIESVTIDENRVTIDVLANNGNYGFSIDNPEGPFQPGNVFSNVECGYHTAYVNAGNECGTASFLFEIMIVPAYFTPNGDGFADFWNIGCGENYPNSTLQIFDRYGKLIKQISASGSGWDGTYNGNPLPSTDYWYILNRDDGRTSRGHFTLKR